MWSNIIAAFAGSSTEALGAATVNDLYFLHERGTKMGIYIVVTKRMLAPLEANDTKPNPRNAIAGGNTLGPLMCGFVITNLSWRWHKWIAVILTGLNSVAILLCVPESRYHRENEAEAGSQVGQLGVTDCASQNKIAHVDLKTIRRPSEDDTLQQLPRKTWVQELSLWSGVPDTNLLKMFIRYVLSDQDPGR
ncbi:hypothetical protein N0V83_002819 [Neocucurbitaria cava]|uniref:Uncharacterized protein n=1 Tax=Neocucurbitaria cava TaxID=798079 RepID=A0A9W8YF64_9PLEO|nr:hypothetical protein N0V83_002819 [Neocucurbitaria cava]